MNIAQAQADMRHAFFGGATELIALTTVWFVAGFALAWT
jgi:hypothetical protein